MTASALAEQLIAPLEPQQRALLADDPRGALRSRFGLTLQEVSAPPTRGHGGACDGMSFLRDKRILFAATPGSNRENFTLLRELGHFLAEEDDRVWNWAADRRDPERAVEEVCDRVAAALLLPASKMAAVMRGERPSAAHILDLFNRSVASREVCAIAIAEQLGCLGFAAVVHLRQRQVTFAARRADTRPAPWRADPIPPGHALLRLRPNGRLRTRSWWPFGDGEQHEYWLDACADARYGFAILAEADLWGIENLHVTVPTERRRVSFSTFVRCRTCGREGESTSFPCSDCGQSPCRYCGKCDCELRRRAQARCSKCNLLVPLRTWKDGLCGTCRR
ncbi:MAG: ImmA/IrrE family metallo-endopeptidase [Chloroflexota bacterium]|nr:MAG: ImmA/IrrE family metallo-endopeptidase [Chloroflexota bacterium]